MKEFEIAVLALLALLVGLKISELWFIHKWVVNRILKEGERDS